MWRTERNQETCTSRQPLVRSPSFQRFITDYATVERKYPRLLDKISTFLKVPNLKLLIRRFLFAQMHPDEDELEASNLPMVRSSMKISVFHSATATFSAPTDPSSHQGVKRDQIRAHPNWRGQGPRKDTVLVVTDANEPGMLGMDIARVHLLFSFTYQGVYYPCALAQWFSKLDDCPDPVTGFWRVAPDRHEDSEPIYQIIHLDTIFRAVHLLPCFGDSFIPNKLMRTPRRSLDAFRELFVNCFTDHHSYDIIF